MRTGHEQRQAQALAGAVVHDDQDSEPGGDTAHRRCLLAYRLPLLAPLRILRRALLNRRAPLLALFTPQAVARLTCLMRLAAGGAVLGAVSCLFRLPPRPHRAPGRSFRTALLAHRSPR